MLHVCGKITDLPAYEIHSGNLKNLLLKTQLINNWFINIQLWSYKAVPHCLLLHTPLLANIQQIDTGGVNMD